MTKIASALAAILLLCAGCTSATGDAPAGGAASVVAALRGLGLEVRDAGTVDQPFFGVPAHVYVVDGNDLQLYELGSAAEAEAAAAQVSPTGSPIGTAMVSWMAPPHFFRRERLVANYIGTSARVLAELERLLGPQFAGQ